MRALPRLAPALLLAGALAAQAPDPPDAPLASLIQEALAANPQLKAAQASLAAERTKVPQAGALPDPMVTLGYRNEGFRKLTYGTAMAAFGEIGVSQSFPYPGKRRLREGIAEAGVAAEAADVDRVRLDLVAAVKRAYVDLLRVRGQAALLEAQTTLWEQVSSAARARLEAGAGEAADLLRAQVESLRLAQRAADLKAQDQALVAELDRLAGRPAGAPLDTPSTLEAFPLPPEADPDQAARQALDISPELTEARHHLEHYRQQIRLARLDLRPDFTVGAAYMPQGSLPGMWSVSVGFNVPIWSGRKQRQALAGAEAETEMQDQRLADLRQRLEAATRARAARLSADLRIVRLYEAGLLAQSDAAYRAALNQYASGAAPFRAVLEALSGRLQDQGDHLEARARACLDAIDLARALPDAAPSPASMTGGAR